MLLCSTDSYIHSYSIEMTSSRYLFSRLGYTFCLWRRMFDDSSLSNGLSFVCVGKRKRKNNETKCSYTLFSFIFHFERKWWNSRIHARVFESAHAWWPTHKTLKECSHHSFEKSTMLLSYPHTVCFEINRGWPQTRRQSRCFIWKPMRFWSIALHVFSFSYFVIWCTAVETTFKNTTPPPPKKKKF